MSNPTNSSSSTGRTRLDSPSGQKPNLSSVKGTVNAVTSSKPPTPSPTQSPKTTTQPFAVARGKAALPPNKALGKNVPVPSLKGATLSPASKPIPRLAKNIPHHRAVTATPSRLKSNAQSPATVVNTSAPNQSAPGWSVIGGEVPNQMQNTVPINATGMPTSAISPPIINTPINQLGSLSAQMSLEQHTQELSVIEAEKRALQQEVIELNEQLDVARGELTNALGDVKKSLDQNYYFTEENTSLYMEHVAQISTLQSVVETRERELRHERIRKQYAEDLITQLQEQENASQKIIEDYRKYGPLPGGDDMTIAEKMCKYREEARSLEIVAQMKTEKVAALEKRVQQLEATVEQLITVKRN